MVLYWPRVECCWLGGRVRANAGGALPSRNARVPAMAAVPAPLRQPRRQRPTCSGRGRPCGFPCTSGSRPPPALRGVGGGWDARNCWRNGPSLCCSLLDTPRASAPSHASPARPKSGREHSHGQGRAASRCRAAPALPWGRCARGRRKQQGGLTFMRKPSGGRNCCWMACHSAMAEGSARMMPPRSSLSRMMLQAQERRGGAGGWGHCTDRPRRPRAAARRRHASCQLLTAARGPACGPPSTRHTPPSLPIRLPTRRSDTRQRCTRLTAAIPCAGPAAGSSNQTLLPCQERLAWTPARKK